MYNVYILGVVESNGDAKISYVLYCTYIHAMEPRRRRVAPLLFFLDPSPTNAGSTRLVTVIDIPTCHITTLVLQKTLLGNDQPAVNSTHSHVRQKLMMQTYSWKETHAPSLDVMG